MKKILFCAVTFPFLSVAQNPCALAKTNNGFHPQVASANLTNLENKYDLKFYHLNIDVERTSKFITGNVRTLATVKSASLDTFGFELHSNHTIDSVVLGGVNLPYVRSSFDVYVPLPASLLQGAMIDATIYYHGTAPTINGGAIGDGYNNATSQSWGNQATWSLSESYVAEEWFPCKQQLQDKLDSSWVFATTDSTNKVGSNGDLTNIVTVGSKKRYEWKNHHPIDYYLISVACAKYVEHSFYAHPANYPDSVLIQNYIYDNPATLTYFKPVIDSTKQLLELESSLFGPYPWADQKYGHCMAPFGGGMEHQTMTSIGYFDFQTVAHELGHQWWGDRITCRTWHDIFINESFAAYTEHLVLEYLEPNQAAPQMLGVHNNVMSQPNGSVYNPDTSNVNRIFDSRLSYDKGGAILHTLRFVINDDTMFFKGLRNYSAQFANSTASIDDFKNSMANFTGMNFNQFFTQWIYGEGYPTFNVKWNQNNGALILKSIQTTSTASITPLYITPIEYKVQRNIGDTIIRVMHQQSTEQYVINMPGTVTGIVVDPNNWIINKVIGPTHDGTLTGIAAYENTFEAKVYPNPAHEKIMVSSNSEVQFELCDLSGKVVVSRAIRQNTEVDLSDYSAGMYFYKITGMNSGFVTTGKLVKQ